MGKDTTEIIEASDTYLKIAAIIINIASAKIACNHPIAKNIPSTVVTPFPSLNFKETFQYISDKGNNPRSLAGSPANICGAYIATANCPWVRSANDFGNNDACRDGADEVGGYYQYYCFKIHGIILMQNAKCKI